ncbi:DUF1326 domain-containing protein [Streptomyces sp. NPDC059850]|uniref:DUF1326 domain-containing protein n=1 Tax=Streptomyces sp. NPDC059850 TaxID=3346970 RepID=UPI0036554A43
MEWSIEGRLAGACNCGTPCPCWFAEAPTHGSCDAIGVGIVDKGFYGDVDLTGCKLGVAYRTVKHVWDGGLKVAVYIGEDTPEAQSAAMEQILTGKAGGLLALLFTLVEDFKGIRRVPIEMDDSGEKPYFQLGRASTIPLKPLLGRDGETPIAVHNALMSFGGERLLAKTESRFSDPDLGWDWPLVHADFGPMKMGSEE